MTGQPAHSPSAPHGGAGAAVRRMRRADVEAACRVSAEAGRRFSEISDARIAARADDEPFSTAELLAYVGVGRAWVATEDGVVVGFLVADVVDSALHIEEVDVAPSAGGRGHGSRLVDAAIDHARAQGAVAVTLTTFRDVPWNAPWYRRLGFQVVSERALTYGLRTRREHEHALGLAKDLRVVMRRDLTDGAVRGDRCAGQSSVR